jgi:NADH-quinone oxidoreductase subunit K
MIGIELLLNAAGLNLVAFSRFGGGGLEGSTFTVFIIVLAAAEAVVGLALVLAIHRRLRTIDVDRADELKG